MAVRFRLLACCLHPGSSTTSVVQDLSAPGGSVSYRLFKLCLSNVAYPEVGATRYEKRAVNYRAVVVIASLMMWLSS